MLKGDYRTLNASLARLHNVGEFEAVRTAASRLATDDKDVSGNLNMGYFQLNRMARPYHYKSWSAEGQCAGPSVENGLHDPLYHFAQAIKFAKRDKVDSNEAKALHYYLTCFKGGSGSNRCQWGSDTLDMPSNKKLFARLHDKYGETEWAQKTPYFYD